MIKRPLAGRPNGEAKACRSSCYRLQDNGEQVLLKTTRGTTVSNKSVRRCVQEWATQGYKGNKTTPSRYNVGWKSELLVYSARRICSLSFYGLQDVVVGEWPTNILHACYSSSSVPTSKNSFDKKSSVHRRNENDMQAEFCFLLHNRCACFPKKYQFSWAHHAIVAVWTTAVPCIPCFEAPYLQNRVQPAWPVFVQRSRCIMKRESGGRWKTVWSIIQQAGPYGIRPLSF